MNIALLGYGAMGKEIERIALERGHTITGRFDITTPATPQTIVADVAIDFSAAGAVVENATLCAESGVNLVIGTTGWNAQKEEVEKVATNAGIGVVYGSNFSVGMQLFFRIVGKAAHLVNGTPDYDILMHELHHKRKADSPSGTALSLADIILQNVTRKEHVQPETQHGRINQNALHVSSTRGGEIAGTHTVYLDSLADTIELTHRAKNRSGFALGAVIAAEWVTDKKGFHDFTDIFESIVSAS